MTCLLFVYAVVVAAGVVFGGGGYCGGVVVTSSVSSLICPGLNSFFVSGLWFVLIRS